MKFKVKKRAVIEHLCLFIAGFQTVKKRRPRKVKKIEKSAQSKISGGWNIKLKGTKLTIISWSASFC
jgi:hypothetical protein